MEINVLCRSDVKLRLITIALRCVKGTSGNKCILLCIKHSMLTIRFTVQYGTTKSILVSRKQGRSSLRLFCNVYNIHAVRPL